MQELTLIVAATRNMGIGAHGTMPWQGLRKEMQYFARVTSRVPPQAPLGSVNAVIMGRKTWDSIPPRFRPLKNRLNIVISRTLTPTPTLTPSSTPSTAQEQKYPADKPLYASSLDHALSLVAAAGQDHGSEGTEAEGQGGGVARVFVMGGAQIYAEAAARREARRVLLTSIERDFECDTFFPLKLGGDRGGDGDGEGQAAAAAWVRRSTAELESWTGEQGVVEGGQEEAGTKYEFQMWERM
ncbi:hypothetical protein N3K66_001551 [Trichothecium roseum]|uniref:Uncharacterized protein n=1 Tax=Trichothecium roseum TaxID=47278 RepID=A0ACC0VEY4_9HYPO|nr:hypothetical protein N3K66_001551 [Trichothecium roseum]